MTARFLPMAFCVGLGAIFPAPASAKPMHTEFKNVIAQSDTIVVARLDGKPKDGTHKVKIEVLQVLKGKLVPGKREVGFEDYPNFEGHPHGEADEFVAFIDKDRMWRFAAVPLNGKKVSEDVLALAGFYDHNAHSVTPGLVTLEQLKTYLKNGSLVYRFGGDVYFPEPGKRPWKPGTLRITGTYDSVKQTADVKGLPLLKGFPAQPVVFIRPEYFFSDGHIDLIYSEYTNRPLHIIGRVQRLDRTTGEIRVRFAASAPELLTEKAFRQYVADARLGPCYYRFRFTPALTEDQPKVPALTLTLGEETGEIGRVEGWGKGPLQIISTSYNGPPDPSGPIRRSGSASGELPTKVAKDLSANDWVLRMVAPTGTGAYLVLSFDLGKPKEGADVFRWTFQNELLYNLYSSPVHGTLQLHDGKKMQTLAGFTVAIDAVAFAPNPEK